MQRSICLLAVVAVIATAHARAFADEIWTYKFIVNGSRPYTCSCDLYTYSADVAGSFSLLLNWQSMTGTVLQLNDHLTNAAIWVSTPAGRVLQPADWPELEHGIIGSWDTQPNAIGNFGYQNGTGRLTATGFPYPFDITFSLTRATFNMIIPIDDASGNVTNATAIFDRARIAGDYDGDARVDARDYISLRNNGGSPFDYDLWRKYLGTGPLSTTPQPTPEPSPLLLVAGAAAASLAVRWPRNLSENRRFAR